MWRGRKMICPGGLCIPGDNNKPVPLKDIKVEASIQGFVCKVTSILQYENIEDEAIEAMFVFPMDDDAAVYQFEAEIDDRKIVAECQDSEEAQKTYDDAISQGHTSMLLAQDPNSADVFQCSVGNLPPHKSAIIRFSYVKELPLSLEGGVQFVLPTILNPRYNPKPEDGGATDSKLGDASLAPPNKIPYTFFFQATVQNGKPILNVKSGHEDVIADIADSKTSAVLTLKKNFIPDHDLSFDVYFDKIYEPGAVFAQGDEKSSGILKNNVLSLNFFPELDESVMLGEKEFIFVIDRSGSMGGPRILSAKETLLLFLKSLPADCYFNIVSFGSRHEFLFQDGSRKYSEASLEAACSLQEQMEANFGGTEILRPLEAIYGRSLIDGYPRQVFVLTDGQVHNVNNVIALVKKNVAKTRVFAFGIGEGASTALVKGIARAGQGKAMFVKDEERLQPKVMKILKCAMQEGVRDLKLVIQGSENAKVVPQPVPPLYSGDRLVLYAIIPGQSLLQTGSALLTGQLGNKAIEFTIALNSAEPTTDLAIHRLAAKAQIAQLEGEEDGEQMTNKDKIILLSTSANIVSKYTSMVGVDTEKSANSTAPKKRRVPVPSLPVPSGLFGGRGGHQRLMMRMRMAQPSSAKATDCSLQMKSYCMPDTFMACNDSAGAPPPPALSGGPAPQYCASPGPPSASVQSVSKMKMMKGALKKKQMTMSTPRCRSMAADPAPRAAPIPQGYMKLVQQQGFNGEWKLNEAFASIIEKPLDELKALKAGVDDNVWATALAIVFLQSKFKAEKDEWEMVEIKALQWLDRQKVAKDDVLAEARKILQ